MDRLLLLSREEIDRLMEEYQPPDKDPVRYRKTLARHASR